MTGWNICQQRALIFRAMFPQRMHILRLEDVLADPLEVLSGFCKSIGVAPSPSLVFPSWNGQALPEVYPWGTIRLATTEANLATARELPDAERNEIAVRARSFLEIFGYEQLLGNLGNTA